MKLITTICIFFLILVGCGEEPMNAKHAKLFSLDDIPKSALKKLSKKKIYFGHQSVGNNIIDGIKKIMEKNPELQLDIKNVNSPDVFDQPALCNSKVGKNSDPESKCDAFKLIIDSEIGNKVDIAFFKFCFVDIQENTDLEEVFGYYINTMEYLKSKYTKVNFIHVTTPLTAIPNDLTTRIKSLIKRIIKKPDWVYAANVQRNKYNTLISNKYYGKEPIFDLAMIESTWPDGQQQYFRYDGNTFNSLVPVYTNDGGHLNDQGQIQAAKSLIKLLCELD